MARSKNKIPVPDSLSFLGEIFPKGCSSQHPLAHYFRTQSPVLIGLLEHLDRLVGNALRYCIGISETSELNQVFQRMKRPDSFIGAKAELEVFGTLVNNNAAPILIPSQEKVRTPDIEFRDHRGAIDVEVTTATDPQWILNVERLEFDLIDRLGEIPSGFLVTVRVFCRNFQERRAKLLAKFVKRTLDEMECAPKSFCVTLREGQKPEISKQGDRGIEEAKVYFDAFDGGCGTAIPLGPSFAPYESDRILRVLRRKSQRRQTREGNPFVVVVDISYSKLIDPDGLRTGVVRLFDSNSSIAGVVIRASRVLSEGLVLQSSSLINPRATESLEPGLLDQAFAEDKPLWGD